MAWTCTTMLTLPPLLPVPALPVPALPPLAVWQHSPEVNPTQPGWYVCRWRAEFPEARMYWDGVWWCVVDGDTGEMRRLEHINIKSWGCQWRTP